jgi:hypothetical protein
LINCYSRHFYQNYKAVYDVKKEMHLKEGGKNSNDKLNMVLNCELRKSEGAKSETSPMAGRNKKGYSKQTIQ